MRPTSSPCWPAAMSSDTFRDAAAAIGRRLVREAIWDGARCSWMGAAVEPKVRSAPEYRPLGPLIYDGTAGVGLFLAELAAATGEAGARRTAVGALRHALERAHAMPPAERDGFQAGTLGVAWAAARVGRILGEEELITGASDVPAPSGQARGPDLVTGGAGTAVALLGLALELDQPRFVQAAMAAGELLLESATVTRHGWSWRDPIHRRPHHQCGAAHGAAGIGWALLELFAATADERFRVAAVGAFAYERSWLDRATGTWPDLRLPSRRDAHVPGMTATWCYGEVGIALSRLRALELLGDGEACLDADISVATTRNHLAAGLPFAMDDTSLCHGLAGAADTLITAGHLDVAAAFAEAAIERYGESGGWPCGVYGTTPGLFRGLSGIGWLFLRLGEPSIASPLALPSCD